MIRLARLSDASALARINKESLGYDFCEEATKMKLKQLMDDKNHVILVAEKKGQVIAYCHASKYDTLYFDTLYNLLGLAVKGDYQGQGIGQALLHALEERTKKDGIAGIRVNSGIKREKAHDFYLKQGYTMKDDQKRFFKDLNV